MYLKEIIISGFKSFCDNTKIELNNNITGVVGPNGSGKSNIVDAVRWVLGEQSVKSLRGTENMSDVIFSGSAKRGSLNKASVTLVLDNSDRYFPLDYTDVEIKRKLYRDGTNEYYLNGEKCRLKDITDILMDSGMSKESFNIISQGKVEKILSDKPEDRRLIFEEASGVLKYKKRKEKALRKLERTHDNLNRVNDIINEIEPRIEPLKNDSVNAKEYLQNKKELEDIELALITEEINNINHLYEDAREKIEALEKEVLTSGNNYEENDTKIDELRDGYEIANNLITNKQKELVEVTSELEKLNSKRIVATERQKYASSDKEAYDEALSAKEEVLKVSNMVVLLEKDISDISKKLENLNKVISDLETSRADLKLKKDKAFSALTDMDRKKVDLSYKIKTLTNQIENNSGLFKGVKSVLDNPRLNGIHNIIGKLISIEEKNSTALEVGLGGATQFIVCDNEKSAKGAINYLKENHLGKATFFPLDIIKARKIDEYTLDRLNSELSFIGMLSDLVSYDLKYENIILNQLGTIVVASDMKTATHLAKIINYKYRVVTLDGELIHVGGSLTGGKNRYNSSNVIRDRYNLESLIREEKKITAKYLNMEREYSVLDEELKKVETSKYEKLTDKVNMEEQINNKEALLFDSKEKHEELSSKDDSLEKLSVLDEYYEKKKDRESLQREVEKLIVNKNDLHRELEELEQDVRKNNSDYNKKQNELKNLEIKNGKFEVKLDTLLVTLNEEYNMTFEKAKDNYKLDIPINVAKDKVRILKSTIDELGVVNIGSIEEFERVNKRYEFLTKQRMDLYKAEEMILEVIGEMDLVMKDKFRKSFDIIEEKFKKTFSDLFGGGTADLILTNPEDILETGIDITCQPPGKHLKHISLLSGGEKALTSISLLFAILSSKTVPFCILDEVEAALDDVNVKRFGDYLKGYSEKTQFIVITHKKKTMEYADVLYGVTMQESGVSKLVSVKLEEIKK